MISSLLLHLQKYRYLKNRFFWFCFFGNRIKQFPLKISFYIEFVCIVEKLIRNHKYVERQKNHRNGKIPSIPCEIVPIHRFFVVVLCPSLDCHLLFFIICFFWLFVSLPECVCIRPQRKRATRAGSRGIRGVHISFHRQTQTTTRYHEITALHYIGLSHFLYTQNDRHF